MVCYKAISPRCPFNSETWTDSTFAILSFSGNLTREHWTVTITLIRNKEEKAELVEIKKEWDLEFHRRLS